MGRRQRPEDPSPPQRFACRSRTGPARTSVARGHRRIAFRPRAALLRSRPERRGKGTDRDLHYASAPHPGRICASDEPQGNRWYAQAQGGPETESEAEERRFWQTHDTTNYVDWSRARSISLANLRPTTTTISLRLPAPLLADLKCLAHQRDVPYQSLLKVFLADRVAAELRRR